MEARVLTRAYDRLPWTIESAPYKAYFDRRFANRAWAVRKHDEIRIHPRGWVTALVIDVDDESGATTWRDSGTVPPPSLAVENRDNGHAHLVYPLRPECWVRDDNLRGMALLNDVRSDLIAAITGADPAASGKDMMHSPWSPAYRARVFTDREYSLTELRAIVPRRQNVKSWSVRDAYGRNDFIFRDGLRYGRAQLASGRVIDGALEADIRERMITRIPIAEARYPNDHSYKLTEVKCSLASIMRYLRQAPRRKPTKKIIPINRAVQRKIWREQKRRYRNSHLDRATYCEQARDRSEVVQRMRNDGASVLLIANTVGISRSQIYRILSTQSTEVASPSHVVSRLQVYGREGGLSAAPLVTIYTLDPAKLAVSTAEPTNEDHRWLLNPNVSGCGLSPRLLLIRDELLTSRGKGFYAPFRPIMSQSHVKSLQIGGFRSRGVIEEDVLEQFDLMDCGVRNNRS